MPETSDPILKEALEKFKESQDGSEFNRQEAEDDIRFARLSDQWPDDIAKIRKEEGRPFLTINRLPAYIRQVVNESRQNKPAIKVSPVDNGADVKTAGVIGGLVRSIERKSNAEVAYDTAIDHSVTGGFGFFRINIDYAHPDSFDLEAQINRIPNPLMVHWDTSSTEFDASDWDYAFVSEMVRLEEYEKTYPGADAVDFEGEDEALTENWLDNEQVRVAEYWTREENKRTIIQMSNGRVVREDNLFNMAKRFLEDLGKEFSGAEEELIRWFMAEQGLSEARRREAAYHEVKRRVISGADVLEEEDWPGSTIPICPVWGEEVYSDGRRHFRSMIRDAKDPQQMTNFWRSASTELVALAPRAPWVAEEGAIPKGKEAKWQTANTRSHPYLEYAKGSNMPQRQPFAGVPAGALQEAMNAAEDMQDIMGIYPSSIGDRSNETSGKAILARERQGDVSNFHFIDNLARAIQYAGRVLVEIIPSVYSPRESIRILGEDMKEEIVQLTQEAGGADEEGLNGQDKLYNLSVGRYDVTVSTGPSFATQREETREALIEIMRNIPDSAQYIGDVLMEHMDFQGADKVAKRLQMLLPQAVRDAEDDGSDNPELAAMKAQLQQIQQQAQAAVGQLQQENEALKTDKSTEQQKAAGEIGLKQRELELKERELALKEIEAQKEEPDDSMRLQYEANEAEAQRQFEAEENDKNRQAEIAKILISKSDESEGDDVVSQAMQQALEVLAAPKRVIRDETGRVIGVEPIQE